MNLHAWMNWFHAIAAVIWVGGLCFLTIVLIPLGKNISIQQKTTLTQLALGFRPLLYTAMALIVASGTWQIIQMGGMKNLPMLLHIKITLALIMIILTLLSSLVFLPRMSRELAAASPSAESFQDSKLVGGLVSATALAALMGIAILGILAKIGIL